MLLSGAQPIRKGVWNAAPDKGDHGGGLAAMLQACGFVQPVDPEDAAERAIAGAALGTALGVGLGATFAINPGPFAYFSAAPLPAPAVRQPLA